jgi:hypothetical protein
LGLVGAVGAALGRCTPHISPCCGRSRRLRSNRPTCQPPTAQPQDTLSRRQCADALRRCDAEGGRCGDGGASGAASAACTSAAMALNFTPPSHQPFSLCPSRAGLPTPFGGHPSNQSYRTTLPFHSPLPSHLPCPFHSIQPHPGAARCWSPSAPRRPRGCSWSFASRRQVRADTTVTLQLFCF